MPNSICLWLILCACLSGVTLLACSQAPEPAHTVSWYREHDAERNAAVYRCAEDPGRLGREPHCINAKRAAAIEDIGSFQDLPPMGLLPEPKPKTDGAPGAARAD